MSRRDSEYNADLILLSGGTDGVTRSNNTNAKRLTEIEVTSELCGGNKSATSDNGNI